MLYKEHAAPAPIATPAGGDQAAQQEDIMRAPRLFTAILAGAAALGGVSLTPTPAEAYTYYRGGYAYHAPRPYYRPPPPPVYYAPRPYYRPPPPPPVYYAPRPYYRPPPVYVPPPVLGFGVTVR
jgi:hypothetical protein